MCLWCVCCHCLNFRLGLCICLWHMSIYLLVLVTFIHDMEREHNINAEKTASDEAVWLLKDGISFSMYIYVTVFLCFPFHTFSITIPFSTNVFCLLSLLKKIQHMTQLWIILDFFLLYECHLLSVTPVFFPTIAPQSRQLFCSSQVSPTLILLAVKRSKYVQTHLLHLFLIVTQADPLGGRQPHLNTHLIPLPPGV